MKIAVKDQTNTLQRMREFRKVLSDHINDVETSVECEEDILQEAIDRRHRHFKYT